MIKIFIGIIIGIYITKKYFEANYIIKDKYGRDKDFLNKQIKSPGMKNFKEL